MSTTTTYIVSPYEDTASNDAEKAVNQTVDDINELYVIMAQVGISQEYTQTLCQQMSDNSSTNGGDTWYAAGTNSVDLDMILALLSQANTIAGGLSFISQLISVIADLTNDLSCGQTSYLNLCEGSSKSGYDPTVDENNLYESLSAFNETEFTIYYANGNSETVTGLLNVLSNNSLDPNGEEPFWGDSGMCPMDATTASLLDTSISGIQGEFEGYVASNGTVCHWDKPETYMSAINDWSGTTTTEEGIEETSPENSEINNYFGQADSQLETNSTELSNDLSYGMTLYEQDQGTIEEIIDSVNTFMSYINNQLGK